MADLDDFFAKKDKKKGKTKKYVSSEELSKQLESAAKERDTQKQKSNNAKIEEETEQQLIKSNQEPDDEWKEVEEEKKVDLSNLKLGQLTLNSDENDNNQNTGNDYENDYSQFEGDNSENPWNKAGAAPPTSSKPEAVQLPAPKSTGAYVAPSMRGENAQRATRLNRKNAPDLQNEEFFPSLGTERPAEPIRSNKKDGFEEVKHGGKFQQTTVSGSSAVSTGNAYSSLLSETLDS